MPDQENRRAAPVPREVGDDEAPPVGMTAVAVQEQQPGQTALPPGQQFYPGADAVETAALRHIGQGRLQPGRTRRRRPAVPRQRVVCPRLSHQNFLVRVNATRRPSALACPGSQPPALLTKGRVAIEQVGHRKADCQPAQHAAILEFIADVEIDRVPARNLLLRGCQRVGVAADMIEDGVDRQPARAPPGIGPAPELDRKAKISGPVHRCRDLGDGEVVAHGVGAVDAQRQFPAARIEGIAGVEVDPVGVDRAQVLRRTIIQEGDDRRDHALQGQALAGDRGNLRRRRVAGNGEGVVRIEQAAGGARREADQVLVEQVEVGCGQPQPLDRGQFRRKRPGFGLFRPEVGVAGVELKANAGPGGRKRIGPGGDGQPRTGAQQRQVLKARRAERSAVTALEQQPAYRRPVEPELGIGGAADVAVVVIADRRRQIEPFEPAHGIGAAEDRHIKFRKGGFLVARQLGIDRQRGRGLGALGVAGIGSIAQVFRTHGQAHVAAADGEQAAVRLKRSAPGAAGGKGIEHARVDRIQHALAVRSAERIESLGGISAAQPRGQHGRIDPAGDLGAAVFTVDAVERHLPVVVDIPGQPAGHEDRVGIAGLVDRPQQRREIVFHGHLRRRAADRADEERVGVGHRQIDNVRRGSLLDRLGGEIAHRIDALDVQAQAVADLLVGITIEFVPFLLGQDVGGAQVFAEVAAPCGQQAGRRGGYPRLRDGIGLSADDDIAGRTLAVAIVAPAARAQIVEHVVPLVALQIVVARIFVGEDRPARSPTGPRQQAALRQPVPVRKTVTAAQLDALVILAQDEVDHPRDRIRAIDRRSAIGDDLDPLNRDRGDGIDIDIVRRDPGKAHPLPVDQRQGCRRPHAAQIDRAATGGVGAALPATDHRARCIDAETLDLRDLAQEFAEGRGGLGRDVGRADRHHVGADRPGAANAAAGHDDGVVGCFRHRICAALGPFAGTGLRRGLRQGGHARSQRQYGYRDS
jgi:hypothetical protein